jgi:hypothetical protein
VSLYVAGLDRIVDGRKLGDRLVNEEKGVLVVSKHLDHDYDHIDCLWSLDCIERVGKKIVEDIWFTTQDGDVIVPSGCHLEDKGKLLEVGRDPEKQN